MKLVDITDRLKAVDTEMRAIYDAAEKAGTDLAGADLEKWTTLDTERRDLKGKEERARTRDELDRKSEATPIEKPAEDAVWALTKEQRMADFHKKQTGDSCEGLSVGRVIAAMVTGNWRHAEAERRVMGSDVNATGGYLLATQVSANLIDLARNASVMITAGALTVPMASPDVRFVRVLTDPTAAWRAEGASITASDATFGAVNFFAKSLAARVIVNAELLDDVPSFAPMLDRLLASALGLELDRTGLYGAASPTQPVGIRDASGVKEISMGANGAVPTNYDNFLDVIRDVELANGSPTTMIWSPRTKNTLAKLATGISGDLTKLTPPADFAALRKLVSNQVSITETQGSNNASSTAFFGGFDNYTFGIRQQIQIEASKVSGDSFEKNQVHVRAILRSDGAPFRATQLGRLIGIRAS